MTDAENPRVNILRANLLRMAIGAWQSHVLFSATRLRVFSHLATDGPMKAEQLASVLGTETFATELLLNACAATRLIYRDDDGYRNADIADHFLVDGRAEYLGDWVSLLGDWEGAWSKLDEAVAGRWPVENPCDHLGEDPKYTEHFILAMHQYACVFGGHFVDTLNLEDNSRLIDVGGGAGSYSLMLCRKYKGLHCVVFDLPAIEPIANRMIASHSLGERVRFVAGDYHSDALPGPANVVLVSNVLQQESPEACRQIIARARDALAPGGMLIVQGMFLEETRTEPLWSALHSIAMLLIAGGRAYTFDETRNMLADTGFKQIKLVRPPLLNAEGYFLAWVDDT